MSKSQKKRWARDYSRLRDINVANIKLKSEHIKKKWLKS